MKDIDLKSIKARLSRLTKKLSAHLPFIVIMVVLFIYLFVVWRINELATAEPTPEQESTVLSTSQIPSIDKKAINQIQALEDNSADIKSFFNEARQNPFDE